MQLSIYAAEATIYDGRRVIKNLGFVHGAEITDANGKEIASVGGSDEYSFYIDGVVSFDVKDEYVHAVVKIGR